MPSVTHPTSQRSIENGERVARAVEMRTAGASFDEIAAACGWNSRQAAFEAVKRALEAVVREPAKELLALELERIDRLWGPQFARAKDGDLDALGGCLRMMERRARLLGLDAAEKRELTGADGAPLVAPTIYIGTEAPSAEAIPVPPEPAAV